MTCASASRSTPRAFDSDDAGTQAVMADAPHLLDHLDTADAEHFEEVKELLGAASVRPRSTRPWSAASTTTRTIFSFVCSELGAQSEIGGGGRYDGLIKQLGGPDTPAIGWAAGIERILLALDEEVDCPAPTSSSRSGARSSRPRRSRSPPSSATTASRSSWTSPAAA